MGEAPQQWGALLIENTRLVSGVFKRETTECLAAQKGKL
jgi:hypothetical protein